MVTIKDIAQETGLSPATVARALSRSGSVRADTQERVLAAAERLGYVVSDAARAMRGQSSNIVGLMVPDITNRFYSQMAAEIGRACAAEGLHLLLAVTNDDPEQELRQMRSMVAARAGAVALVPAARTAPGLAALAARQPFIQLVRRSAALDSAWYGFDEESAFRDATGHLLALGHRRIGLISSGDGFSTGRSRFGGYAAAFAARGLAVDPALVQRGPASFAFGAEAMERLLPAATAVVAAGSLLTEGAADRVHRAGIAVPRELSFVGFGIELWHGWWNGGMTRLVPAVEDLARTCAVELVRHCRKAPARTPSGPAARQTLQFVPGATCRAT